MGRRREQNKQIQKIDAAIGAVGTIAMAQSGREAGRLYMIVGGTEERGRVFIADGRHRRLGAPKLKSCKHLRYIGVCERARELLPLGRFTDGDIRRAISEADKPPKGEPNAEG